MSIIDDVNSTVQRLGLIPLLCRIKQDFEKVWAVNDEAHRESHFAAVFLTGIDINEKANLGFDPKLILLAAYFHDMFAWSRVNHHDLSAQYVLTTDHPIFNELTQEERELVSIGCREHRASRTDKFSNVFGELINSADRMFPDITGLEVFRRSFLCTMAKTPLDYTGSALNALTHIKEKFGTGGYARLPDLYRVTYGDAVDQQQRAIDEMMRQDIWNIAASEQIKKIPVSSSYKNHHLNRG